RPETRDQQGREPPLCDNRFRVDGGRHGRGRLAHGLAVASPWPWAWADRGRGWRAAGGGGPAWPWNHGPATRLERPPALPGGSGGWRHRRPVLANAHRSRRPARCHRGGHLQHGWERRWLPGPIHHAPGESASWLGFRHRPRWPGLPRWGRALVVDRPGTGQ